MVRGRPGARRTHLAAAEDVVLGDTHVEMPDHGLRLLLGLEGAVYREAAPSPQLGLELRTRAAVELGGVGHSEPAQPPPPRPQLRGPGRGRNPPISPRPRKQTLKGGSLGRRGSDANTLLGAHLVVR